MSSTTVAEFASELKKTTEVLLEQLKSAGVAKKSASDTINDADKHTLLAHLKASHGSPEVDRRKITLVKKSTTEIKQADASGKARAISVTTKKMRTFVRRDDDVEPVVEPVRSAEVPPAPPAVDVAGLARREEEARQQAELIRRQEEDLAQRRREREEQEQRAREQAEKAAAEAAKIQKKAASANKGVPHEATALPEAAETKKAAAVEVVEDFSIVSRQKIRDELEEQMAAFLARGGKIAEVPANVTADPPKKPSPDYGGRPI